MPRGSRTANRAQLGERIEHHRKIYANSRTLLAEVSAGSQLPRDVAAIRTQLMGGEGMRTPYELQHRLSVVLDNMIASFTSPSYFDPANAAGVLTAFSVTFGMIVELEVQQIAAYEQCERELAPQ